MNMLTVKYVTPNLPPKVLQHSLFNSARWITLHCDPDTCLNLFSDYIPVVSSEDYASENINGVLEDLLSSNILLQYVESENDIKVIERLQEKLEERKKILERKS